MEGIVFSIIIPAHNEQKYVKRCIDSVRAAAEYAHVTYEVIVVCNRCTDSTEQIAKECGARTFQNQDRCIAKVRNTGISNASGKYIVTIDADNRMTEGTLSEIYELMNTGRYIGGGASIRFERHSFPLWCNEIFVRFLVWLFGLHSGIFWSKRETFNEIGGFPELPASEDLAAARLLKKLGKKQKKKYGCLKKNYLINSTRKFDEFGDWLMFRLMLRSIIPTIKAAFGHTEDIRKILDEVFYDYNG